MSIIKLLLIIFDQINLIHYYLNNWRPSWGVFIFMLFDFNENLFSERFLIKTTRLSKWDYSSPGFYFITICTINKTNYFGNIWDGKMILSDIGQIVNKYWYEIPNHFNNVKLDEFIVMPNHVHGIIRIQYNKLCNLRRDAINRVFTNNDNIGGITKQNNPMLNKKSIPYIIRWYKGITTHTIRQLPNSFIFHWQPRYYDRIIRNKKELNAIRQYIKNNPKNWEQDRNNILIFF